MEKDSERELKKLQKEIRQELKDIEKMRGELEQYADLFQEAAEFLRSRSRKEFWRLPEDYPPPREILRKHFPRTADQCCFKGGWGYDAEHATVVLESDPEINPDEKFDGVSLEYAFIDKRIREELFFALPEGQRYCGLEFDTLEQSLVRVKGVPHDRILVKVTAYPEIAWNELKADWEAHNGYKDDPKGREENLRRKNAVKVTYETEFWFNIADFF